MFCCVFVYAGSTLWLHSLLGPIATKQNNLNNNNNKEMKHKTNSIKQKTWLKQQKNKTNHNKTNYITGASQ